MDYSQGLPQENPTLVVVPSLLSSERNVEELLDALEVRFLGNQDPNLRFGLLTDFCDAGTGGAPGRRAACSPTPGAASSSSTRNTATRDIRRSSCSTGRARWNPRERTWMGYERKRGKLADLNLLLRGEGHDRFSLIVGDVARLLGRQVRHHAGCRHRAAAGRRPAARRVMAHPLNTPRFDERKRRVVGGYGILQPRMATTLPGANRSRYAQLYGSEPGIDPYTRSVSDVYQDLFGEGSFIGKGIYDVDAFERACKERFPDNCDPQPRPARGLLRALGPAERRAAVRGLPRKLRERRPPA